MQLSLAGGVADRRGARRRAGGETLSHPHAQAVVILVGSSLTCSHSMQWVPSCKISSNVFKQISIVPQTKKELERYDCECVRDPRNCNVTIASVSRTQGISTLRFAFAIPVQGSPSKEANRNVDLVKRERYIHFFLKTVNVTICIFSFEILGAQREKQIVTLNF